MWIYFKTVNLFKLEILTLHGCLDNIYITRIRYIYNTINSVYLIVYVIIVYL